MKPKNVKNLLNGLNYYFKKDKKIKHLMDLKTKKMNQK